MYFICIRLLYYKNISVFQERTAASKKLQLCMCCQLYPPWQHPLPSSPALSFISSPTPRSPPSFSALSLLPTAPAQGCCPLSWLRLRAIQDLSFPPCTSLQWHEYFHTPHFWLCPNKVSTHFTWFMITFPGVSWAPSWRMTLPVLPIWSLTLAPPSSPLSFPMCISLPPNTKCCLQLHSWHSSNCRDWLLDWAGMSWALALMQEGSHSEQGCLEQGWTGPREQEQVFTKDLQ